MKSKEGELVVLLSAPPPSCGVDNCFSEKQDTSSDDIFRLNEDTCAATTVAFSPKKCYLPIICLEVVVVV